MYGGKREKPLAVQVRDRLGELFPDARRQPFRRRANSRRRAVRIRFAHGPPSSTHLIARLGQRCWRARRDALQHRVERMTKELTAR
jgi:hypothetical protein